MDRRCFLKGAALAGAALRLDAQENPRLILTTKEEAARLKHPSKLAEAAKRAMTLGPWSVTFKRPGALSEAGPHDFFSEGPYWWPDPANPKGPYIRRDGQTNPERFTANDDDMGAMSEAVFALGLAAYFLKDREAAARAWRVLQVWFLDEATRMTPHLEYGQAIRGVTPGRGIGIIDSRPLIWCVLGAALLEASFPNSAASTGLRSWFGRYVEWLTTSRKGTDERDNGNNHSTWWAAQVAAYSVFCGNGQAEKSAYALYRDVLVPKQLRPDGSAPAEEARTRSLAYSVMNLDGFAMLCRIAEKRGVDLWSFKTKDGAGVLTSAEYIVPFLIEPRKWTKPQITPADKVRGYFPGLAGMATKRREWVELQRKLGVPGNSWGTLFGMMLESWDAHA